MEERGLSGLGFRLVSVLTGRDGLKANETRQRRAGGRSRPFRSFDLHVERYIRASDTVDGARDLTCLRVVHTRLMTRLLRPPARVAPLVAVLCLLLPRVAFAHGVAAGDKGYLQEVSGVLLVPFAYLGAKHMVTGYDHLLFLLGVIFFLYRLKDVGLYVTLFAVGHSITLLTGVLTGLSVNAYLIDAIIGLSVVYKALDNLRAFDRWFGRSPDPRVATLVFGLFHGLGLATKILDFQMSPEGMVPNLVAFNVGVELGQLLALAPSSSPCRTGAASPASRDGRGPPTSRSCQPVSS